jgi:hypothetical protein
MNGGEPCFCSFTVCLTLWEWVFTEADQRARQRAGRLAIKVVKLLVKPLMKLYQTGPYAEENTWGERVRYDDDTHGHHELLCILGYLVLSHYNFSELEKRHYYSSISKFATAIFFYLILAIFYVFQTLGPSVRPYLCTHVSYGSLSTRWHVGPTCQLLPQPPSISKRSEGGVGLGLRRPLPPPVSGAVRHRAPWLWQPAQESTVLSPKTDPLWSLSNNKVPSCRESPG